jgi:hypothetical protein
MRVAIINPWLESVTIREMEHNLESIYSFLTLTGSRPVDDFNIVRVAPKVALYVDGEGFLKEDQPVWTILGYSSKDGPLPLAGMGILYGGENPLGDALPLPEYISDTFIRKAVKWTTQQSTGVLNPTIETPNSIIIGSPILKEKQA